MEAMLWSCTVLDEPLSDISDSPIFLILSGERNKNLQSEDVGMLVGSRGMVASKWI